MKKFLYIAYLLIGDTTNPRMGDQMGVAQFLVSLNLCLHIQCFIRCILQMNNWCSHEAQHIYFGIGSAIILGLISLLISVMYNEKTLNSTFGEFKRNKSLTTTGGFVSFFYLLFNLTLSFFVFFHGQLYLLFASVLFLPLLLFLYFKICKR